MAVAKSLTHLVASTAIALGITGCQKQPSKYLFDGYIGGDRIRFYESALKTENFLSVTKENGDWFFYLDLKKDDLEIEHMVLSGESIPAVHSIYSSDQKERAQVELGQKEFENYLRDIRATRKTPRER
jgi:hypothetical protein